MVFDFYYFNEVLDLEAILFLEASLIAVMIIYLFYLVTVKSLQNKNNSLEKQKISRILINLIESKLTIEKAIDLLKTSSVEFILKQMQEFDNRFTSEEWKKIRQSITEHYLLPAARELVNSSSWLQRNFAANCFALASNKKDKEYIFKLAGDPYFLVASVAAKAVLQLEMESGLLQILVTMGSAKGFAYCYYRDIILNYLNIKNYLLLQKIASEYKDEGVHLACLDLLATRRLSFSNPFLWADLKSTNPAVRAAALKIFVKYPQPSSYFLFVGSLEDPNPDIRVLGIRGLRFFLTAKVFDILTQSLFDGTWQVRLEAAKVLKKFGAKGVEELESIKPVGDLRAYEVAQYVLNFF